MGVLNLTPDSFSDGGELPSIQAAVDRAGSLLKSGADVLDLGGESTRPGAAALGESEELNRVLPVLVALRKAFPQAPLSIDTYKPAIAAAAVRAGADLVNDIWGCAKDLSAEGRRAWIEAVRSGMPPPALLPSQMAEAVAALGCPLILMHHRLDRKYRDFWDDLLSDLKLSLALARGAGVADHQLWLDPGFGFAKDPHHNLEAIKHLERIVALGYPVLLGTSRKSTIGRVLGAEVGDRLDGTAATLVWGIQQGCAMVRIHDVAQLKRTVIMADAIKAGLSWAP